MYLFVRLLRLRAARPYNQPWSTLTVESLEGQAGRSLERKMAGLELCCEPIACTDNGWATNRRHTLDGAGYFISVVGRPRTSCCE
jgi:hypothetical protein